MARRVVILAECDVCGNQATSSYVLDVVEVSVDGENGAELVGRRLDLCPMHRDLVLGELVDRLEVAPLAVGPAPEIRRKYQREPTSRHVPCPLCSSSIHSGSLVAHVWARHRKGKRPPTPAVCPDCGYSTDRPQVMGTHRKAAHGFNPLADALDGAS